MFVPYSIVNPLTVVRMSRRLRKPGDVLATVGDPVEPAHIVAQRQILPEFRIVDIARELGGSVKKVRSYLKVKRGQKVSEGDVLAARGGLSSLICRAPIDGTVVGSGRGRLLLEAEPRTYQLTALIPGVVIETWPTSGVLIETVGALIQCAWGNGQENFGPLRVVVRAPRHPIRPKHIDASAQGAILVGGSRLDEETLERAIEMQVRGIIVGGVPVSLLSNLKEMSFPVVATEGVGETPMSKVTFDLLRSLDGRDAALSGRIYYQTNTERPYIVVPMPAQNADGINPDAPITVGSPVRVLRGIYAGVSGTVSNIPNSMVQLETGARLPGVQVDFGSNDTALIPYVNLERLL